MTLQTTLPAALLCALQRRAMIMPASASVRPIQYTTNDNYVFLCSSKEMMMMEKSREARHNLLVLCTIIHPHMFISTNNIPFVYEPSLNRASCSVIHETMNNNAKARSKQTYSYCYCLSLVMYCLI